MIEKYEINADSYCLTFDKNQNSDLPFPITSVSVTDVQKAYIKFRNEHNIYETLKITADNEDEYNKKFWRLIDDGSTEYFAFWDFERYFRIKKVIEYCEENFIPYWINKKDKFIKSVCDYCSKNNIDF